MKNGWISNLVNLDNALAFFLHFWLFQVAAGIGGNDALHQPLAVRVLVVIIQGFLGAGRIQEGVFVPTLSKKENA